MEPIDTPEYVIDRTLTAATNVHRALGPGLLESVYERAMQVELEAMQLKFESQVPIRVMYRGQDLEVGFNADIIVEDTLLLELKSVRELTDLHLAQTLTYLKLTNLKRGFLLNFNTRLMKDGIKRVSIGTHF